MSAAPERPLRLGALAAALAVCVVCLARGPRVDETANEAVARAPSVRSEAQVAHAEGTGLVAADRLARDDAPQAEVAASELQAVFGEPAIPTRVPLEPVTTPASADDERERPPLITGWIADEWSEPVSGVHVILRPAPPVRRWTNTQLRKIDVEVDDDGSFRVFGPQDVSSVSLFVGRRGYRSVRLQPLGVPAHGVWVCLGERPEVHVTGRIVTPPSWPGPGAFRVLLESGGETRNPLVLGDGRFETRVMADDIRLRLEYPAGAIAVVDERYDAFGAERLDLGDVQLVRHARRCTTMVVDAAGRPRSQRAVRVEIPGAAGQDARYSTGAGGELSFVVPLGVGAVRLVDDDGASVHVDPRAAPSWIELGD